MTWTSMTPLRPDFPAVDFTNFARRELIHFSSNVVGECSVFAVRKPLSDERSKMCRTAGSVVDEGLAGK
jgi:hypothetical protein